MGTRGSGGDDLGPSPAHEEERRPVLHQTFGQLAAAARQVTAD